MLSFVFETATCDFTQINWSNRIRDDIAYLINSLLVHCIILKLNFDLSN